ncbi:type I glyceraldehyde-3-phosphate dehydrogenase [Desulfallas sp. Bu1-1]|uniref:type I glyceraldehyde-3-phosphate dehydrogenase n=1 Tax=Desulfallas sp. Bu1-1 TaxID=2787620 RepID=UPI00189DC3C6|nr:type I glyceraldehyde-3-phosphate dehydrogenase [Desulfallas sp. Bu1-1]MBF7082562.1 type I glyceraldehyde-3-phosphate dehydrogenase [Desulfallas sp. Bu1-1]
MTVRVAINGFGRIGRNVFRAAIHRDDLEIVAINDLTDPKTLAHLLKFDSVHGTLTEPVLAMDNCISVNDRLINVFSEPEPRNLPWGKLNVDVVVESTGRYTRGDDARQHVLAGAKKVVISAPGKGVDATIVMGVNHHTYDPARHHVISNASCTTNCLAPVVKVIHERFGINYGTMTTVHSYTNDQRILDLPHKDLRRARAAAMSIIPTSTGAARAVSLVLPEMAGRLNGLAMRVPTPNVSVVDFVAVINKPASVDEVNLALKEAAEGELQGILEYCDLPLVSRDFYGNPHSSIVDALSTMVIGDNMIKVIAWYDNEWGYSCRVVDLVAYIGNM